MAKTGKGGERYPQKSPSALIGGGDLGPAMRPQEIFILIRKFTDLRDDHEVVEIMRLGAAALHEQPSLAMDLSHDERGAAIEQAAAATPSRVVAWRKRAREMTWLELRIFLIGLAREALSDGKK